MKGNGLKIPEFQKTLIEHIEDIKKVSNTLFDFPLQEKLNKRPLENKWSVVEHLDHMNSIVSQYFQQMDKSKSGNSIKPESEFYKPRFLGRLFVGFMEPPPKVRLKTFSIFEPQQMDISKVKEDFHNLRNELVDRLNTSVEKSTLKSKLSSPLSSMLKFEFGEAFMILTAHDRRHIYSINNFIKQL